MLVFLTCVATSSLAVLATDDVPVRPTIVRAPVMTGACSAARRWAEAIPESPLPPEEQRPRGGERQPGGGVDAVPAKDDPKDGKPKFVPFDAVRMACADLASLPPDVDPYYVRYVSLYNNRPSKRAWWYKRVSFAVNSVSRGSVIKLPVLVQGTESTLIRLDLRDYQIDPKEWDRLAELGSGRSPLPEPYFQSFVIDEGKSAGRRPPPGTKTATARRSLFSSAAAAPGAPAYLKVAAMRGPRSLPPEKQSPGGSYKIIREQVVGADGRPVTISRRAWVPDINTGPPEERQAVKSPAVPGAGAGEKTLRPADHLVRPDGGLALACVLALTGTDHPILRGDWFVSYSLWAPRYYDLLGLGGNADIKDFQKLLKVRAAEDADVSRAGIVVRPPRSSGVALNNRFIFFITSANDYGSYYWQTNDSKTSTDGRQYLNVLIDFLKVQRGVTKQGKDDKKFFDATEDIGTLRNGLQAYFLTDGAGKRLDKADADIAIDRYSRYQDSQVWSARNCITCHTQGIKSVPEAVRDFSKGRIGLLVVDDDAKKTNTTLVTDFFGKPLDGIVKAHQAYYEETIKAVTLGDTAADNAKSFMEATADYLDGGVTLDVAAWEVGVSADELAKLLKRGIGLDPTLTGLLQEPAEEIRRDQYENNSFSQLMTYLQVYRQKEPPAVRPR